MPDAKRLRLAVATFLLVSLPFLGERASAAIAVEGLELVSSVRSGRATFDYTYRLKVANGVPQLTGVVATVRSTSPRTTVLDGSVMLGDFGYNEHRLSTDTFSVRHDRTVPFDRAALQFEFGYDARTPSLSVGASADVIEGEASVEFAVTLDLPASDTVTVEYATRSVTGTPGASYRSATEGADYVAAAGTISIPAGQLRATIVVPIVSDDVAESDELFGLELRNPTQATLGSRERATVRIYDDDRPPPPGANFGNSGSVVAPAGASLAARRNSLRRRYAIEIGETGAPALALPNNLVRISGFFRVGANENVVVTNIANPLALSVPVPGVMTDDGLALAVLPSDSLLVPGDVPLVEREWGLLYGRLDPSAQQYRVSLTVVPATGFTVAVVRTRGATSAAPTTARLASRGSGKRVAVQTSSEILNFVDSINFSGFDFFPSCIGRNSEDKLERKTCAEAVTKPIAEKLKELRGAFKALGYIREPWLPLHETAWDEEGLATGADGFVFYVIELEPGQQCSPVDGRVSYYHWFPTEVSGIFMCVFGGVLDDYFFRSLAHEYFHAIQGAYAMIEPLPRSSSSRSPLWFIEGTAEVAAVSWDIPPNSLYGAYRDTDRGLREVARYPLVDDDRTNELGRPLVYRAQDFWVHHLRQTAGNQNIGWFERVLVEGGWDAGHSLTDIKNAMARDPNDLADSYWAWVKNQAYEKSEKMTGRPAAGSSGGDSPFEESSCFLENLTVPTDTVIDWPSNVGTMRGTLDPLDTVVLRFHIAPGFDEFPLQFMRENNTEFFGETRLRYKVYRAEGAACDAGSVDDGNRRHGERIRSGVNYYVIISNTDTESRVDYRMTYD